MTSVTPKIRLLCGAASKTCGLRSAVHDSNPIAVCLPFHPRLHARRRPALLATLVLIFAFQAEKRR